MTARLIKTSLVVALVYLAGYYWLVSPRIRHERLFGVERVLVLRSGNIPDAALAWAFLPLLSWMDVHTFFLPTIQQRQSP